jgi:hypothetical protein
VPTIDQASARDLFDSDDGYSTGRKRIDHADVSAVTSRNFDPHPNATDAGTGIVVKSRLANAESSTPCNFEDDSNVTDGSDLRVQKQYLHKTSPDAGMLIVYKSLHRNARSSIRGNFEFDSNVPDASNPQLVTQDLHTTSTDEGISIVCKLLHRNAGSSIRGDFMFDSNAADGSDLNLEKQDLHTTSTDAGMSIVFTLLNTKANVSIRCNFEFDSHVTDGGGQAAFVSAQQDEYGYGASNTMKWICSHYSVFGSLPRFTNVFQSAPLGLLLRPSVDLMQGVNTRPEVQGGNRNGKLAQTVWRSVARLRSAASTEHPLRRECPRFVHLCYRLGRSTLRTKGVIDGSNLQMRLKETEKSGTLDRPIR